MKKVLFVAIIATLIAVGCEKTEIINPNLGTEILFSPELGKLTKAEGEADATLKDQGFKVSAINAYDDLYTTDVVEFNTVYRKMDNLQFIYGTNGWALQNGQSYFWPGTGKDLVFLAVSSKTTGVVIPAIPIYDEETEPTEQDFGISGTKVFNNGNPTGAYSDITVNNFTIPNFEVTAPSYEKKTVGEEEVVVQTGADDDLMVAKVVIQNQGDEGVDVVKGKVKLDFSHTLSKVQFIFTTNTNSQFPVTVNKVEIKDVINKATLGVGVSFADGSRTSTNTYDWSPSENDEDDYYLAEKNATTQNYTNFVIDYNLSLVKDSELTYATWLVIPQSLEGKMVSITYTITDTNNNSAPSVSTSVFPLYTTNLNAWSRNQYVRYKINLSPNLITFDPVVSEDWSNPTDVEHNN